MKIINPVRDSQSPRTKRLTTFHPFLRLPAELQLQIWEMSLEDYGLLRLKDSDVISLYPMNLRFLDSAPGQQPEIRRRLHIPVPPLKQVCHTSRHTAERWLNRELARYEVLRAAECCDPPDKDDSHSPLERLWIFSLVRKTQQDHEKRIVHYTTNCWQSSWEAGLDYGSNQVYVSPDDYRQVRAQWEGGYLPKLLWHRRRGQQRRRWCSWELTVPLEVLQLDLDALVILFGNAVCGLHDLYIVVDGLPRGRAGGHIKTTDWVVIDRETPKYRHGKQLVREPLGNHLAWDDGESIFKQEVYDLIEAAARRVTISTWGDFKVIPVVAEHRFRLR
ncbi:hypothetical protein BO86DRAFT_394767 [Aspergillus japonicus CBS 114.51]|uniref:2EXR domain-containing protein n=1 Tax=Aspergillus japonicus CBS 114.51 TaxID=1448312 RepID=A0A8T8XF97_ASPJA|nr:hypothetical protein BO86DRAFT_394767 [Aspergillus japonicus CBS 114.51]RAH86983.1 hypothetical protein BO86DRAFT_394767 [Aspergillus japonicus CBS 114.51]